MSYEYSMKMENQISEINAMMFYTLRKFVFLFMASYPVCVTL